MIKKIDHLNLKQTAYSGQCFRWKELAEGRFGVTAFGNYLEISETEDADSFELSCNEQEWNSVWASYFDMETDYMHIEELITASDDEHLKLAFSEGSGIRILKQDLWEMIISYLISQNNNITRIKRSIDVFCERCGYVAKGCPDGITAYRFPNPEDSLPEGIFDDASLGLGYRNVYLKEMYAFAKENPEWLETLRNMDYITVREELLKRKGIGPKVADCISLFGLHHIEAFPIDTHVKQLLAKYYPEGFDHAYFEGVAGIIQQYLFYYELNNKK